MKIKIDPTALKPTEFEAMLVIDKLLDVNGYAEFQGVLVAKEIKSSPSSVNTLLATLRFSGLISCRSKGPRGLLLQVNDMEEWNRVLKEY